MVKANENTGYHEVPVIQVEGQNIDDSQIPMINIVTEKKSFQVTPAVVKYWHISQILILQ
jgi:hypothetical protein